MKMCRAVQRLLEIINVVFILAGISLIVTGSVFAAEAFIIPGPLGPSTIGIIVAGCIMIFMGIFGAKAARDRKIEGKELRGKCMLIIYAIIVFFMFACILTVVVVLFIWLGGVVPNTGQKDIDNAANIGIHIAQKPFDNFVSCSYHACCWNTTRHENHTNWPECLVDRDGIPDTKMGESILGANKTFYKDDARKFKNSDRVCEMLSPISCALDFDDYRTSVAVFVYDKLSPFGIVSSVVAGLLFFGWLFSLLEIFWCCGESDLDESSTIVYPDEIDQNFT